MKPETIHAGRRGPSWSMTWGIIMFACGVLAITLPLAFSIGIVVVLAWLILLAAVVHLVFAFHSHSIGGFLWKLLLALFYGAVGTYMVMNPLLGLTSVTIVVAILFLCEGLVEVALYFHIRHAAYAGWVLVDGIITLIVGFLIWDQWPSNAVWVLGTLVGISLIFSGISRIMLSLAFPTLSE